MRAGIMPVNLTLGILTVCKLQTKTQQKFYFNALGGSGEFREQGDQKWTL